MVEVAILAVLFWIFIPRAARWPHRDFWQHMAGQHALRAEYCSERAWDSFRIRSLDLEQEFKKLAAWHGERMVACESGWVHDRQEELAIYERQLVREFALLERYEQRKTQSTLVPDSGLTSPP